MAREQNKYIVLEIGVGGYPFPPNPTMLRSLDERPLSRRFDGNLVYIGVDCPKDPYQYWFNWFIGEDVDNPPTEVEKNIVTHNLAQINAYAQKHYGQNVNFLEADAHDLPFTIEGVDEIFISNVLGSQIVGSSEEAILSEVHRVLKPGGFLVIRESLTPQWSYSNDLPERLHRHGFVVTEIVQYGSSRYKELLNTYGATHEDMELSIFQSDIYFCLAVRE